MSELKTRMLGQTMNEYGCDTKIYLKSEADKVIAEKDTEIAELEERIDELEERIDELQKATDSAWSKVNAMYDELRHHKYRRCLAMAYVEWLKQIFLCIYPQSLICRRAASRKRKWLELAEKLKEAK